MVYSHAELQAIADVLLANPHVYIISDDIYEHIYWADEPFRNLVMQAPALYDRTLVINGVSKTYAMTGWRIGYTAGPKAIIKAMKTIQSQSTGNPCSVSQVAAEAALNGSQSDVTEMTKIYQQRQQLLLKKVNAINGFRCGVTQGAFYLFCDVSAAIKQLQLDDDVAFSEFLLTQVGVEVIPGSAFGLANHIRISYATSETLLLEAIARIEAALNQ
jgi:aspartate aminotransferase